MSRRKSSIPKTRLNLHVSSDLMAKLGLELLSEVEGRVPHGDYTRFFETRLREHFESDYLLLAPFGIEGIIKGPAGTVRALRALLESQSRQLKETERVT